MSDMDRYVNNVALVYVTDVAALATEMTDQRAIGVVYRNLHGRLYFA